MQSVATIFTSLVPFYLAASSFQQCSSIWHPWTLSRRARCTTIQTSDSTWGIFRVSSLSGMEIINPHSAILACSFSCEAGETCACTPRHGVRARLHQGDEYSWTALISQYTNRGQARQALKVYQQMQALGVKPSSYTFVAALKACSCLKDIEMGTRIHAHVVASGCESDVFVGTMLVDVYAKCGSLVNAWDVFEKMVYRDVVSWNAMILGSATMDEGELALDLYARMQKEGISPDARTFVGALKACSRLAACKDGDDETFVKQRCLEQVMLIHSEIVRRKLQSNVYVGTMLVDVYAKCGNLEEARHVFERVPHRNVVSWNAMILGCAQMEEGKRALQFYARMQREGVKPNDRTFVGALRACSSLPALEEANGGRIVVDGKLLEQVRAIHSDILKCGFESDVFVGTMLVDAYVKSGSLVDAKNVFDGMPYRDSVSWNAMILGYAKMDEGEKALHLFTQMQQEGVAPDGRTYVCALNACGIVAGLEKGKEIHAEILKTSGGATDLFVSNSLIDMYGKCGSMGEAQQVFDVTPTRSIVTWTALIAGYARQGESQTVFDLVERMKKEGMQPNGITILSVLNVCSHVGLVESGKVYFKSMSRDYGITPTIEHYTCMINLFGRAGELDKAMAIAKLMPIQPDGAVWESVLAACQKWKNVDLGYQAFQCAVRLDKNDVAAYVLMSNIYAAVHMWDDVKAIHKMRVNTQAGKQPGHSFWTDMGGIVHEFGAGDRKHPECKQTYAELGRLFVIMREEGCVHA